MADMPPWRRSFGRWHCECGEAGLKAIEDTIAAGVADLSAAAGQLPAAATVPVTCMAAGPVFTTIVEFEATWPPTQS